MSVDDVFFLGCCSTTIPMVPWWRCKTFSPRAAMGLGDLGPSPGWYYLFCSLGGQNLCKISLSRGTRGVKLIGLWVIEKVWRGQQTPGLSVLGDKARHHIVGPILIFAMGHLLFYVHRWLLLKGQRGGAATKLLCWILEAGIEIVA